MVNEPISPSIKAFDFLKVTIIFVFRCTVTNKSLFLDVFVTCSLLVLMRKVWYLRMAVADLQKKKLIESE